jgi:hypothetical protein
MIERMTDDQLRAELYSRLARRFELAKLQHSTLTIVTHTCNGISSIAGSRRPRTIRRVGSTCHWNFGRSCGCGDDPCVPNGSVTVCHGPSGSFRR